MRRLALIGVGVLLCAPLTALGQEVFHSTQSANLPTAEIYPRGSWLFEISHRFGTPISEGARHLWGLDGPVNNRLGLTYSAADRLALGVQRTNLEDNLELNAKAGVWSGGGERLSFKVSAMGGVAWNTDPALIDGAEDNEMQAYGQLILNALIGDRIAVGVVPALLYNPRIRDFDEGSAFAVGMNGQLYFSDSMSLLVEWLVSEERTDLQYDPAAFGLEIETRGHFFKLLVLNQRRPNPTQFLGGSRVRFEPDEWILGFNIQRLLPF